MGRTIWEPQQERAKIDLRLPRDLYKQVHDICVLLGISKTAFFALSASLLLIQLAPLHGEEKSAGVNQVARTIIQKVAAALHN